MMIIVRPCVVPSCISLFYTIRSQCAINGFAPQSVVIVSGHFARLPPRLILPCVCQCSIMQTWHAIDSCTHALKAVVLPIDRDKLEALLKPEARLQLGQSHPVDLGFINFLSWGSSRIGAKSGCCLWRWLTKISMQQFLQCIFSSKTSPMFGLSFSC